MARTNTRRDHELRADFFEEGRRLDANPATREQANCWLCKERIDYLAAPSSTPDSHNLDHVKPVRDYPEFAQDWSNFRHSHFLCNGSRGAKAPSPGLGEQVAEWWD